MEKIEIKHPLKGWRKVDKESAIRFVKSMIRHTASLNQPDKIDKINKELLRGTTVKDLLQDK